ncbi:amidohydrolase family protein [Saccharopolyspora spinosporotrichia]
MPAATAPAVDFVLLGGKVVDGSGTPARVADVAVKDGRVVAVESGLRAEAGQRIDVTELTVVPGFIDPHSHSDWSVLGNRDAQSTIRQGVTTEVVGNCGVTYAPSPRPASIQPATR